MALTFLPPGAAPPQPCGGCTACCKLISVQSLGKPPNRWCEHCDVGRGCRIYAERPDDCSTFQCLWTLTPRLPERIEESIRAGCARDGCPLDRPDIAAHEHIRRLRAEEVRRR